MLLNSPLSSCQEEPLLLVKLAPLYSNMLQPRLLSTRGLLSNKTTMGDRRLDLFPLKVRTPPTP